MRTIFKTTAVAAVVGVITLGVHPAANAATPARTAVTVSTVNGKKAAKAVSARRGALDVRGTAKGLPAILADAGDSSAVRAGTPARVAASAVTAIAPLSYAWSYGGSAQRFAAPTASNTTFDTKGLPTGPVSLQVTVTDARGAHATGSVQMFVFEPIVTTVKKDGKIGPGLGAVDPSLSSASVDYKVAPGIVSTDLTLDWDDPNPLAALPDPAGPTVSDMDLHVKDPSKVHDGDATGATQAKPERMHFDNPAAGAWSAVIDDFLSGPATYHLTIANTSLPASPVPVISAGGPYRFTVGQQQRLQAAVTGGTAPYKVTWDRAASGTFTESGTSITTSFGLGAHLVTARVTDAKGYTARQTVPVRVVNPGDIGHTSPYVVVAVVDSGINPYHLDWATSTYPDAQVLSNTDNFTQDPATYISGYPAGTPSLPIHLGQGYNPPPDKDLWADKGNASQIKPNTLYWIPGTKIIGARDNGRGNGVTGIRDEATRILDTNGHGTASASVAVGNLYGSCKFCLLVVDKGLGSSWAYSQPWIDIVSNSFGSLGNVGLAGAQPPTMPAAAAERGQLGLYAAGNGNENAFITPEQTYTSESTGPDWVLRIGAVNRATRQPVLGTGKPVTASSFGEGNIPAADHLTVSGETQHSGTSAATPISAGVFGTALGASRSALGDSGAGQRFGGAAIGRGTPVAGSPYLKDGVLTRSELVKAVIGTARHGDNPPSVQPLPPEIPPNPYQYAIEGYGILDNASGQRAIDALLRGAPLEPVPSDQASFFAQDSALRVQLWGKWAGGGANSAYPSSASATRSSAQLGAAMSGLNLASVSTFAKAMTVLGSMRAATGHTEFTPASTPGASPAAAPTISITTPVAGDVVSRDMGSMRVAGSTSFPGGALPGTPTRYFVRRDQCGAPLLGPAPPANPHLSRTEDKNNTDKGSGCGQTFQALANTGIIEFSTIYPVDGAELPAVLGSGHPIAGSINLSITGASPIHTITVQLVDGVSVIGSQDVTKSAVGVSASTAFPFSFPVPAGEIGKLHDHLALKVITRTSTAVQAGTITKGSYIDIPRAVGTLPQGAAVEVSVDDAKFAHPTGASVSPSGSWSASVPTSSLRTGAHRLFARLRVSNPVASTSSNFLLGALSGPGVVQVTLTRVGASQPSLVAQAADTTGNGTYGRWAAKLDTSKLDKGKYRMVVRVVQGGNEAAQARAMDVTLR